MSDVPAAATTAAIRPAAVLSVACAIVSLAAQALSLAHLYSFNICVSVLLIALTPLVGMITGAISIKRAGRFRWVAIAGLCGSVFSAIILLVELSRAVSSPNFLRGMIG